MGARFPNLRFSGGEFSMVTVICSLGGGVDWGEGCRVEE